MAENKIEIVENTLMKLLIRRGTNADRQQVTLQQGELGFTTDTKKLYIGDGATQGGVLVTGTKFLGVTGDLTSLSPGDIKDLGFDSTTNKLMYIVTNDGSSKTDWAQIGGVYSNSDGTITITANNDVVLGDAAGAGLEKDTANRLEIAASIATDTITAKNEQYLSLPRDTAFGDLNYTFPGNGSVNTYLRLNSNGALTWSAVGGTSTTFVNEEIVPVGTISPYTDSSLPAGGKWLNCDGAYVDQTTYADLFAVVGTTYGPTVGSDFKLPDLRGKVPLGFTNTLTIDLSGAGRTFALGVSGGLYEHALDSPEFQHYHGVGEFTESSQDNPYWYYRNWSIPTTVLGRAAWGNEGEAEYAFIDGANYGVSTTNVQPTSGVDVTVAHPNVQPFLAVNYIIKALPDVIADCNIVLNDSLTAREATYGPDTQINPLSGVWELGLATILDPPKDLGYIDVNNKGIITSYDTTSAGQLTTIAPQATEVTHEFGFTNFLYEPVPIVSVGLFGTNYPAQPGLAANTWGRTIQVYPEITSVAGAIVPAVSVPKEAKNVILDISYADLYYGGLFSCLEESLSGDGADTTARTTSPYEYRIAYANDNSYYTTQVTVPLSASPTGAKSFHLRGWSGGYYNIDVRVIGWTL